VLLDFPRRGHSNPRRLAISEKEVVTIASVSWADRSRGNLLEELQLARQHQSLAWSAHVQNADLVVADRKERPIGVAALGAVEELPHFEFNGIAFWRNAATGRIGAERLQCLMSTMPC